jgi:hypothetical protein
MQIRRKNQMSQEDAAILAREIGDDLPPTIHDLAFIPAIRSMFGSEQQVNNLAL